MTTTLGLLETENTAAGCLHMLSPPPGGDREGKRKLSFAPRRGERSTVKSKRRRRSSAAPECGDLGVLPVELLEICLSHCGARELGALNCTSRFFSQTNIVERVARRRVEAHPRADGIEPRAREKKETFARLLNFADAADVAMRTSAGLSLGAFHTAVLGVAAAAPARRWTRRRTDARDFARRRGIGDDEDDVVDDGAGRGSGSGAGSGAGSGSTSYRWGRVPPSPAFPTPSEEDQRDEHGMSVFAPIVDGFGGADRVDGDDTDDREIVTPAAAAAARAAAAWKQPHGRTLYTFGRGFHGQLGQGGYDDSAKPAAVRLVGSGFADPTAVETVSCGASHCAALDPDGVLLTWGLASSGELGHGGWTPIEVDVPRRVSSMADVKVTQIAAGANHTVVVSQGGGLWTCGRGRHGQLGHGHFHDAGPLQRLEALRGMSVMYAVAGGSHSLCLTDCGSVWSWGACRHGQLGLGDITFATAAGWESGVPWPCLVETLNDLDEPVVTMAAGGHHTLFVTAGGQLWASGRGEHGALGVGVKGTHRQYYYYEEDQKGAVRGPKNHLVPRLVPVHHKPAPRLPANPSAACGDVRDAFAIAERRAADKKEARRAARLSMRASCGAPMTMPATGGAPGAFATPTGREEKRKGWVKAPCSCGVTCRVVHAAAGGNHSTVLTACGAVMCTGSNAYGQLGQGDTRKRYAFARVESLRGTRFATVAAGEDHAGAVAEDGRLFLWGRGDWGQLGTDDGRSHWTPRVVDGVHVAPPVAAERYLGFTNTPEAEDDAKGDDDPRGEMGGPNQHAVADPAAEAVYG